MDRLYLCIHTAAHGSPKYNGDTTAAWIDKLHRGLGWAMIGYNFVDRLSGEIEEGRPLNRSGAHCPDMGMNRHGIGICFAGHGDYWEWTLAQRKSGFKLMRELMDKYSIPPENVLGHREAMGYKDPVEQHIGHLRKTCPGLLISMDDVRAQLAGKAVASPFEYDPRGMFGDICNIFDDPNYHNLPAGTQKMIKALRRASPFGRLTREDLEA